MKRPNPTVFGLGLSLLFALSPAVACSDAADNRADVADTDETDSAGDTVEPDAPSPDTTSPDGDTVESDTPDADSGDTSSPADGDTTETPDGDTSNPPDGSPPTVERYGARMFGAPIQLSLTDTGAGRLLWLGTRANPDPMSGELRGGLFRYDLGSFATTRFEGELPSEDYSEFMGYEPNTFGPAPTAGVMADGDRFVVVARTGLLTLEDNTVTPFPIVRDGVELVPVQLAIARDGLRPVAWMTSDIGLVRLDEDTFAVESVFTGAELGIAGDEGGDFGKLAVDPDTGAVFATYFATNGMTRVVRLGVDGQWSMLVPGVDGVASGRVGDVVFSTTRGGVYVALGSWSPGQGGVVFWDGTTATEVVREGVLGEAHFGEVQAFGAQVLALDEVNGVLAVGGQVQGGFTGNAGGGLVLVDLTSLAAPRPKLLAVKAKTSPLIHWHLQSMVWDTVRRELYFTASDLCNEVKLRTRGLFSVRFDAEGRPLFTRPFMSTLRELTDVDGELLAGMRDDNGGLACESMPIQAGLGRVELGGLGLIDVVSTSGDGITSDPGVTAMHSGDGVLTVGTWRDGFLVGAIARDGQVAEGFVGNPALLGPSLFLEAVWHRSLGRGGHEVWLAGRTSHQPGDPPQLADRGPRGMARLELSGGSLNATTHYVRASEDAEDVVGLPSGDIRDLLALPDGTLLAACATERLGPNYDRDERPAFEVDGVARKGGVAQVSASDRSLVTTRIGPETTPDPRALALDAEGRLVIADAERGVVRERVSSAALPPVSPYEVIETTGLPSGAIPNDVWAGAGDDLALATSKGLWLRLGGHVLVLDDVGFAWTLLWRDGRLYVGTDEGLVVVVPEGASATPLPTRPSGEAPPFSDEH